VRGLLLFDEDEDEEEADDDAGEGARWWIT
jgi:hypothetical protein